MSNKRTTLSIAVLGAVAALGLAALPQTAAAQPSPEMRAEINAHPNMVRAIREMEDAYHLLDAAPDNFGGHKADAMAALRNAIRSAKRALFYRMRMDDAALDRFMF